MKKTLRIVLGKLLYIAVFVTIQVAVLVIMFLYFRDKFAYFYSACILLSLIAGVHVLNSRINPAYQIAWLIPIMLMPIFGGLLYLLFGRYRMSRKQVEAAQAIRRQISAVPFSSRLEDLRARSPEAAIHAQYLLRAAGSPPCGNTQTEYFPSGETMYAAMLRELETAQRYIFLEYFIIEEGAMWDGILEILERKARQGVDVRVMYDDLGCLFTLPRHYDRTLRQKGLQAQVFNPFNSILSPRFNNRDHRKICVIDGKIAFTGGINLADEYINAYEKHGHWKDTGIALWGQAAWSLTIQFLALWDFSACQAEDIARFAPNQAELSAIPDDGFVLPYTDIPLDKEQVGESAYLNLINRAKRYVYITTPYLILDNELVTALCTAAKAGVDVRIITPHIPDKKTVFLLTRSYYEVLLGAGVRIYEYTPGFIHAKTMVSDDVYGVVGTINLDYRSLYLHLECAAWLYRCRAVSDLKQDFLHTMSLSQEITTDPLGRPSALKRVWLSILRAFAPLA